jgi:trk system potassium uptake protein TrkH
LFMRHWIGAYEVAQEENLAAALRALWGGVFTVLSFLSTTGFVSGAWSDAQGWSGLSTPGLLLMGLALIGGGVATTAGGVKLLRVYALYMHGARELERLVHPSSVGGSGAQARRIRRQGAYVAWIFFMLFAMSIAAVMLAFALTGIGFEPAVVLTIAALSTTGPLAEVAVADPILYADLSDAAKLVFATAMVLGRLETLAIFALLNPGFWRT